MLLLSVKRSQFSMRISARYLLEVCWEVAHSILCTMLRTCFILTGSVASKHTSSDASVHAFMPRAMLKHKDTKFQEDSGPQETLQEDAVTQVKASDMSFKASSLHCSPLNPHSPRVCTHSHAPKHPLWQACRSKNAIAFLMLNAALHHKEVIFGTLHLTPVFAEIDLPLSSPHSSPNLESRLNLPDIS